LGINRFADPREIADLVAYLCSSRASFINGSVIDIDGGQTKAL
jgi:3-oxoacyl-[acyl-carrier protein] reductase